MVVGDGLRKERVGEIVNETTGGDLRVLEAEDLGLQLPTRDLSFDAIAAPAGLATMSWYPGRSKDFHRLHRFLLECGDLAPLLLQRSVSGCNATPKRSQPTA